jgi:formate dehydrogenase (coenzyme F420) alpha subunit
MPDSNAFTEAFRKLELLVVHDLVMSETAKEAHYVLPAASHLEKWGVAYTYNVCHCLPFLMLRKKCIEPVGQSRSEWWVLNELAHRLGFGDTFHWKSEEELIKFELEPTGLPFDYLLNEKPEGDYYQEKQYGTPDGFFRTTPSQKIELFSEAIAQVGHNPLPEYTEPERGPRRGSKDWLEKYPLILSTGTRNLYYTHSQHRSSQALKEHNPEPMAEIGPQTASDFGIADGDKVVISTNTGHVKMKARVQDRLAEGMVSVPHGWSGEANANLLTDVNCREAIMGYPDMKSLQCNIEKG